MATNVLPLNPWYISTLVIPAPHSYHFSADFRECLSRKLPGYSQEPVLILTLYFILGPVQRSRIKTEEKAKVIAVIWGTYLNAALTI